MNLRMNEWIEEFRNKWMNLWMNEWINERINECKRTQTAPSASTANTATPTPSLLVTSTFTALLLPLQFCPYIYPYI